MLSRDTFRVLHRDIHRLALIQESLPRKLLKQVGALANEAGDIASITLFHVERSYNTRMKDARFSCAVGNPGISCST